MDPPLPEEDNDANWINPNNLVALGEATPGLYRSLYRYEGRCSHIACALPHRPENGFCCQGHEDLALANSQSVRSFHYVGGFTSNEEKLLTCCICLLNRGRAFQVGVPILNNPDIFRRFPWELPAVFRTDLGRSNWIFFHIPPATYKQIRHTKVKWKRNRRSELTLLGKNHDAITMVTISLSRYGDRNVPAQEVIPEELLRPWSMQLFQYREFSLYCLSSTLGQLELDPIVKRVDKPKGKSPPKPPKPPKPEGPPPNKTMRFTIVYGGRRVTITKVSGRGDEIQTIMHAQKEPASGGDDKANKVVFDPFDLPSEVKSKASIEENQLSDSDVLEAIDRGGKDAYTFCNKPATYWVWDPIDGTRGFIKGDEALYVVGLALVLDNEIVLGVMGCPNWPGDVSNGSTGTLMLSHIGCGTWAKRLQNVSSKVSSDWTRCFVDPCSLVNKARFCIPESQTWESLPLSGLFGARIDSDDDLQHKEIVLLPTCCGSLCKYLMVASGRASVFFLRAKTQGTIESWDHAVGIICVHEAGGKVTDWEGDEINLEDQSERRLIFPAGGVVVSNGSLHNQILEMISSSSPTL